VRWWDCFRADGTGSSAEEWNLCDSWVSSAESAIGHSPLRPFSTSDPLRGYNSDLAQYSHTPIRATGFEDEDEYEAPLSDSHSLPLIQTPVQLKRGADQGHMGKSLREISQVFGGRT
jgi:hypothetical protein